MPSKPSIPSEPSGPSKPSGLVAISRALARRAGGLRFGPPTAFVYNPLVYARASHEAYLTRYGEPGAGTPRGRVLLLGMNPGPLGMAQTGVPFGDVAMVRDFLGVSAPVGRPPREHPARPVRGFECPRGEVSGTRLWGWARERFGTPQAFFQRFFVINYCPLVFMEARGQNRTPDKLPATEQAPLFAACDRALVEMAAVLAPALVVGVGAFAATRAELALGPSGVPVASILHPSPANPRANTGWAPIIEGQLRALGMAL